MDAEPKKSRASFSGLKGQSRSKSLAMLKSMSRVKVRKQSYGFTGVPGIRPVERTSQTGMEFKRPPLIYLPTYQLDPILPFHVPTVTKFMNEALDEHWTGHKYNVQESPTLAIRIAGLLMRQIKAVQFNRYRIIVVVTIVHKRSQSYSNCVSFLWDHERDNYVDMVREETTAFIQVTTFGVYLD